MMLPKLASSLLISEVWARIMRNMSANPQPVIYDTEHHYLPSQTGFFGQATHHVNSIEAMLEVSSYLLLLEEESIPSSLASSAPQNSNIV
ncbi:hypothetical protein EDB19DRAFT_1658059 [Suillus lakei]|nr:hypothetical protein EDB19DRAFT_1658059 [Suillus lakei]